MEIIEFSDAFGQLGLKNNESHDRIPQLSTVTISTYASTASTTILIGSQKFLSSNENGQGQ